MPKCPQLYLDSAKLDEVRQAHSTGKLAGITINPSLALAAIGPDGDYADHAQKLYDIVGPECHKSYQVIGKTYDEMMRAADRLIKAFDQYGGLGIKVGVLTATPYERHLAREGLRTVRALSDQGILVNVTTVQRPEHFALAAYLGARLISPFLGRTDDLIRTYTGLQQKDFGKADYFPSGGMRPFNDGYGNVSGAHMTANGVKALRFLKNHSAKVLAASVRNMEQAVEAWGAGAEILTLPFDTFMPAASNDFWSRDRWSSNIGQEDVDGWISVYENGPDEDVYKLLYHPKTVEGYLRFAEDGERLASFMRLVS